MKILQLLSILGLSFILTGCLSYSASKLDYYTFNPITKAPKQFDAKNVKTVLLQGIIIPKYLKTPNIIERVGKNKLNIIETTNWAAPFNDQVERYIIELLQLSDKPIHILRSTRYTKPDLKLKLEILTFEKNATTSSIKLKVRWQATSGDNKLLKIGYFDEEINLNSNSFEDLADAHSKLIEALIKDILAFIAK
jgi:ABC-type uncharacterized transport system auxiliary subunit